MGCDIEELAVLLLGEVLVQIHMQGASSVEVFHIFLSG
jgi:hypothetical protein